MPAFFCTIDMFDIRNLAGRFATFPAAIFQEAGNELQRHIGQQAVEIARDITPYNDDPFRTQGEHARDSWQYEVDFDSSHASLRLFNTAPQMVFLIEGTAPHLIEGDPLAFYWNREDRFFMGPEVNHPGMQPIGFIEDFNSSFDRVLLPGLELSIRLAIQNHLFIR